MCPDSEKEGLFANQADFFYYLMYYFINVFCRRLLHLKPDSQLAPNLICIDLADNMALDTNLPLYLTPSVFPLYSFLFAWKSFFYCNIFATATLSILQLIKKERKMSNQRLTGLVFPTY